MNTFVAILPVAFGTVLLAACDPVSLTVFGVGTATGVQHTLGGITYRTFTAPLQRVRSATLTSLRQMSIRVTAQEKTGEGERIKAAAGDREIEIELDAISPSTTRMRAAVRNGLFMDAATATEIILQTERALTTGRATSASRGWRDFPELIEETVDETEMDRIAYGRAARGSARLLGRSRNRQPDAAAG